MTFLFEPRYEWVEYPDGEGWEPGWHGFKARIRTNPSGAELRHEQHLFDASQGTDAQAQNEYMQYIAPRIVEWNLAVPGDDGKPIDIPAPAERWESLFDLHMNVLIWLRLCVHGAHLGPKVLDRMQGKTLPDDVGTTDLTRPTPIPRAS